MNINSDVIRTAAQAASDASYLGDTEALAKHIGDLYEPAHMVNDRITKAKTDWATPTKVAWTQNDTAETAAYIRDNAPWAVR